MRINRAQYPTGAVEGESPLFHRCYTCWYKRSEQARAACCPAVGDCPLEHAPKEPPTSLNIIGHLYAHAAHEIFPDNRSATASAHSPHTILPLLLTFIWTEACKPEPQIYGHLGNSAPVELETQAPALVLAP